MGDGRRVTAWLAWWWVVLRHGHTAAPRVRFPLPPPLPPPPWGLVWVGDGRRATSDGVVGVVVGDVATRPRRGCGFHCCRRRRRGCWYWWAMGDGRRAGVIVVVVIAVRAYNNDSGFSTVFVTIRENKNTYQQARGRNAPEPITAAGALP